MTACIALPRAVNLGRAGKLPMSDLRHLCESAAFEAVRTYIANSDAVFENERSKPEVKAVLEPAPDALGSVAGQDGEELRLGSRRNIGMNGSG